VVVQTTSNAQGSSKKEVIYSSETLLSGMLTWLEVAYDFKGVVLNG
jgi:hypothetical protein